MKTETSLIDYKIDHESPIPLHVQVDTLIHKLVESPQYQNGKLLPKEVELAKRLGISRNTIRQAMNKLENENLFPGHLYGILETGPLSITLAITAVTALRTKSTLNDREEFCGCGRRSSCSSRFRVYRIVDISNLNLL
jgi:hypothetical protein